MKGGIDLPVHIPFGYPVLIGDFRSSIEQSMPIAIPIFSGTNKRIKYSYPVYTVNYLRVAYRKGRRMLLANKKGALRGQSF